MNIARDVVLAHGEDGILHSTAFVVSFKPVNSLYKWLVGRPVLESLHARRGRSSGETATNEEGIETREDSRGVGATGATHAQGMPSSSAGELDGDLDRRGPANTLASSILSSIGLTALPHPPTAAIERGGVARAAHETSSLAHGEAQSRVSGQNKSFKQLKMPSSGLDPRAPAPDRSQEKEAPLDGGFHKDGRREGVEVYVRGELVPGLEMVVDDQGACVFAETGTTHPSRAALQSLLTLRRRKGEREVEGLLKPGPNPVDFVYCNPYGDVSVRATFHLWGSRDRVVVSDIDGTITKSDIRGYIDSVHLGNHEYTHQGIGRLFSHLHHAHHLRFVYLTSRPISLLEATRKYLANVYQEEGFRLPHGPVFTSMDSLTRVLYRELVEKTIRYMKAQVLNDIRSTFQKAGRPEGDQVFLFGFGNKSADGQAYEMAGVDPQSIFIINPSSEVRMFASYKESSSFSSSPSSYPSREGIAANRTCEGSKQDPQSGTESAAYRHVDRGSSQEEHRENSDSDDGSTSSMQSIRMHRNVSEGKGDEGSHHGATFASYSDARLLRLLEQRLADVEGEQSRNDVNCKATDDENSKEKK